MRIGYGEDAHALIEGRELVLGGVRIPSPRGPRAHSDGDALLHALTDALLSALALGDIGSHFPNDAAENQGRDSKEFLAAALAAVKARGYRPAQVSAVVVLDRPKLGPFREPMQTGLARMLGLPKERVGLSFKTSEGLAPDHVQARAFVLLLPLGEREAEVP